MPETAPAHWRPTKKASTFGAIVAKADRTNDDWQRTIAVSLGKIDDLKRDAGDAAGALAADEESLAIARHLAASDPGK